VEIFLPKFGDGTDKKRLGKVETREEHLQEKPHFTKNENGRPEKEKRTRQGANKQKGKKKKKRI